jgi:hypothetical protein
LAGFISAIATSLRSTGRDNDRDRPRAGAGGQGAGPGALIGVAFSGHRFGAISHVIGSAFQLAMSVFTELGEAKMLEYRSMVVKGYRERLLKTLLARDVETVLRGIGQPDLAAKNALDGRDYLVANWNDNIRDRVMEIITRNIELDVRL